MLRSEAKGHPSPSTPPRTSARIPALSGRVAGTSVLPLLYNITACQLPACPSCLSPSSCSHTSPLHPLHSPLRPSVLGMPRRHTCTPFPSPPYRPHLTFAPALLTSALSALRLHHSRPCVTVSCRLLAIVLPKMNAAPVAQPDHRIPAATTHPPDGAAPRRSPRYPMRSPPHSPARMRARRGIGRQSRGRAGKRGDRAMCAPDSLATPPCLCETHPYTPAP